MHLNVKYVMLMIPCIPISLRFLWCHFINSLTPIVNALSQFQAQNLMLRVASLVRQLASGQRAQLITRSVHYAAVMRKLSSPNRELRLQQFTTSPRSAAANASKTSNSDLKDTKKLEVSPRWVLYEGEGFDGAMHGVGKETSADGKVYEGDHTYGTRNGEGKLMYTDGKFHSGVFRDDRLLDGEGTIRLDRAGEVFEGAVQNGKWNGPGKMSYPDGTYRDGIWKDSMMVQGKTFYPDGRIAEGEWKGAQLLRGKITLKSGRKSEGAFQNNKLHGPGKVTTAKGAVQEGNWVEGKLSLSTSPSFSSIEEPTQSEIATTAKQKKSKKIAATTVAQASPESTPTSADAVSPSGVNSTATAPVQAPIPMQSQKIPAPSLSVKQPLIAKGTCCFFLSKLFDLKIFL